ncbi:glycosyl hydrolase [Sulfurimonas sp. SAG-AH-194-C21]|nr:glycosyl hydrolase [Sulfurimonas sp. SAG-AH-194-C21]MDF1884219.1 glycosyl hydrolase [Sulfurimonas sp. SAG-AH-194-C21]
MKEPFKWDNYSDQPALLTDKVYKKEMRKRQVFSLIKTALSALVILPISLVAMPFVRRRVIEQSSFISLGVDYEREKDVTDTLLKELAVQNILLRCKLWEMDKLDELALFIKRHADKNITLKILQDRENIEDLKLLEKNLETIFVKLDGLVIRYEIGSTINRAKWGFFSVDEYSKFFQVAFRLKKEKFPNLELLGSSVIDFEYHFTAHTLFNFFNFKYDGVSTLLYVDRRGAPENTQLGFTLSDKIAWLSTMLWLSPKTAKKLHITETNWPLSGTAPYAPTSEKECVSEESYANYMLRYYLLAFASQQVDSVAWHQLIAPGYGLVDNRDGIKKRVAYDTFKFMITTLQNAQFLRLDIKRDYYILQCLVDDTLLQVHWSLIDTDLHNEEFFLVYDRDGKLLENETLAISPKPTYIYVKDAVK